MEAFAVHGDPLYPFWNLVSMWWSTQVVGIHHYQCTYSFCCWKVSIIWIYHNLFVYSALCEHTWIVSSLRLFLIKLWKQMYTNLCEHMLFVLLDKYLGEGLLVIIWITVKIAKGEHLAQWIGMPTPHMGMSTWLPALLPIQLFGNAHLGRQQVQGTAVPSPIWETWIGFRAPSSSLAEHSLTALKSKSVNSRSQSVCLFVSLTNNNWLFF